MINSFLIGPLFSVYFMIPSLLLLVLFPLYILTKDLIRKKEDFSSIIAHELRTSLTVIQGCAEILLEETIPEKKKIDLLQKIHQSSMRMNSALDSILILEKNQSITIKECSVSLLLKKLKKEFSEIHPDKVLEIHQDLLLKNIRIHPELFYLALQNLLDNAAKHGKSPIELTVVQKNRQIIFSVQDQGEGIFYKDLPHLFKKGFCKNQQIGHGLGLYLVEKIVQKHKGKLAVKLGNSKGSIFTISLNK